MCKVICAGCGSPTPEGHCINCGMEMDLDESNGEYEEEEIAVAY